MVRLKELTVENYRNIESVCLKLENKFICFTGENGTGKTNLIDSIHYISLGKSYFNNIESMNIRFDQNYFSLKALFDRNEKHFQVNCGYMRGDKKIIKNNGEIYSRLSQHVGEFPVVIITPYDTELIHGSSEERRRFLDIIISQTDKTYLENLMNYFRVLKQRNVHLKQLAINKSKDRKLIKIYDGQLCLAADYLYRTRREFIDTFKSVFSGYYSSISNLKENCDIQYISQLHNTPLSELLEKNFNEDILAEHTGYGPHKDDLDLLINNRQIKKFGSQGQQKSFIISLKLSEYEIIKKIKQYSPLLLLDDVFDNLDIFRINHVMEIVSGREFGQIFITDTDENRLKEFFKNYTDDIGIFRMDKGKVVNEL